MKNGFGSLNEDAVRHIVLLIEALEKSTFDYLQLNSGDVQITLGKGNPPAECGATPQPIEATPAVPTSPPTPAVAPAPATVTSPPAKAESPLQEGTIEVRAPIVGLFYSKPDPAASPFVTLGAKVTKDSTVGLIEVMKVFNAVPAAVDGVITEICVSDAQFVEFGQVLFRIRPEAAS